MTGLKVIWYVKFAKEYMSIFSKPEGKFSASWVRAYQTAKKVYPKRKDQDPKEAALEEITSWFYGE